MFRYHSLLVPSLDFGTGSSLAAGQCLDITALDNPAAEMQDCLKPMQDCLKIFVSEILQNVKDNHAVKINGQCRSEWNFLN